MEISPPGDPCQRGRELGAWALESLTIHRAVVSSSAVKQYNLSGFDRFQASLVPQCQQRGCVAGG